MKLISYIVPVYNAEKYLAECIESILAQKGEDIELILVDDGSLDSSGRICDEYAKKDARAVVIHQKNGGVSSARNAGLRAARGKYIRFVDSDDRICSADEVGIAQSGSADQIIAGALVLDESDKLLRRIGYAEPGKYKPEEILRGLDGELKKLTLHYVWNHFYRRELIERGRLEFDTSVSLGEDFLFNASYFSLCESVEYVSDEICCYYKRGNAGLTGVFKLGELERRRRMDGALLSLYESRSLLEENRDRIDMMLGEMGFLSLLKVRHPLPKGAYKSKISFMKEMLDSEYYGLMLSYLSSERCRGAVKRIERVLIRLKLKRTLYLFEKLKYSLL